MKRYLFNWLVLLDLAANTLLAGSPYETISERCWRHREHWAAALAVRFVDWLFGLFGQADHCRNADEGNEAQYEVRGLAFELKIDSSRHDLDNLKNLREYTTSLGGPSLMVRSFDNDFCSSHPS